MNTILLPMAALLIAVLLIIIYFSKRNMINEETKIYSRMLWINFIYAILAVLTFIYAKAVGNELIIGLLQKVYMISMIALIVLMISYNAVIVNFDKKLVKSINIALLVSFCLFSFFILVTPLNVINYGDIIDGNGLSYDITLLATILYLIVIVVSTIYVFIKNKNVFSKDIPFIVLIIFYVVGIVIRSYFPYVMFENFFFSFMLLIMYFTIENPDLKMLEEFHKTREFAENSNNEKATFLFNISNQVKVPANKINAISKLLLMSDDIEEIKDGLNKIKTSSNNLLDVINHVLNITDAEKREISIIEKVYTPYNVFKAIESANKLKLKEKNIEFKMIYDKTIPEKLYGDSIRIKQLINIIINNAIKYTKKGYIELSVNSVIRTDTCRLIITIEDSGCGIEAEKIEKLFDKSKLYKDDALKVIDDTKMNLGVAKTLVDLIGGVIMVNSEPGKWTKFTITLDQKIAESEKSKVIQDVEKYEKTLKRSSILLVLKSKRLEKQLLNKLQKYSLNIEIIHTKEELTQKLKSKNNYKLIMTEENLDKINCVDIYNKVKQIPVILFLNKPDIMTIKAYEKVGFKEIELLPLKEGQIETILEKYKLNN